MSDSTKPDKTGELMLDLLRLKTWPAKLSFRAIRNVERELDMSMLNLAKRIMERDFRYEDIAVVFHHAIRGAGAAIKDAPSIEEIGELLVSKRIEHWIADHSNLVVGVVTAGEAKRVELSKDKPPGEAKPQTATSGEATGAAPSSTSASTPVAPGT